MVTEKKGEKDKDENERPENRKWKRLVVKYTEDWHWPQYLAKIYYLVSEAG